MIIRKSAIVIVGIFAVLTALVIFGFADKLVERLAEVTLSKALKKEVDIENLDLKIRESTAAFEGMRVGAIARSGKAVFGMKGAELFSKKLVIDEMSINDLIVNTLSPAINRDQTDKTDRSDQNNDKVSQKDEGGGFSVDIPEIDLDVLSKELNISEYTKPENLASLRAIRRIEKEGDEKIQYWNQVIADNSFVDDLEDIKREAGSISQFEIGSLEDIESTKKRLSALQTRVSTLNEDIKRTQSEAGDDINSISNGFDEIQSLLDEDIKGAEKLANITRINPSQISKGMFGGATVDQVNKVLGYAGMVRKVFFKKQKPEPERGEGRYVDFPVTKEVFPRFIVQRLNVNGQLARSEGKAINWTGVVNNLTLEQDVIDLPTTFRFTTANKSASESYLVAGLIDNRGNEGRLVIDITGTNLSLRKVSLGDHSETFPRYMVPKDAKLIIHHEIIGNQLSGTIKLIATDVSYIFDAEEPPQNEMKRAVKGVFASMSIVEFVSTIGGTMTQPRFSISSNIGGLLSDRIDQVIGDKIEKENEKIRQRIISIIGDEQTSVKSRLSMDANQITNELSSVEKEVATEQKKIEQFQRELEEKQQAISNNLREASDAFKQETQERIAEEERKKQAEVDALRKEVEAQKAAEEEKKRQQAEAAKKEAEAQLKGKLDNLF